VLHQKIKGKWVSSQCHKHHSDQLTDLTAETLKRRSRPHSARCKGMFSQEIQTVDTLQGTCTWRVHIISRNSFAYSLSRELPILHGSHLNNQILFLLENHRLLCCIFCYFYWRFLPP
jgi:hypothetical protein